MLSRFVRIGVIVALGSAGVAACADPDPLPLSTRDYRPWSAYGGGPEQLRYSGLDQVNRNNIASLSVAWIWDSGEGAGLQT
jgi:glucose dehydrogenase